MAHESAATWVMAAQAAKAARDSELQDARQRAATTEAEAQAKWFLTRIKTGAPQALVRGMTDNSGETAAREELAGAHAHRPAPDRRPARARVLRARRRDVRRVGLQLGWVAPDRRQAGRTLRARVHRAAPVHRLDLRLPRPRRRRRHRHGPPQRHLGRHRARSPQRASPARRATRSASSSSSPASRCGRQPPQRRPRSSSRRSCSPSPVSASS